MSAESAKARMCASTTAAPGRTDQRSSPKFVLVRGRLRAASFLHPLHARFAHMRRAATAAAQNAGAFARAYGRPVRRRAGIALPTTSGGSARMKLSVSQAVVASALLAGSIAAVSTAAPPTARNNPLQVSMVAATGKASDFLGAVEVRITNTSRNTVRVPKWQLPSDFLEARLF